MKIRILQQFRQSTFTRTGRRNFLNCLLEDSVYVFHFSSGIQHPELLEQLSLQGCRTFLPFGFQLFYFSLEVSRFRFEFFQSFLPFFLQSFVFRFLVLAFPDQGGLFLFGKGRG